MKKFLAFFFLQILGLSIVSNAQSPVIFADVPDVSVIRVGKDYYMSSTTMHMNPGVPIMHSKDLSNWKMLNYAYETLGDKDELALRNGKTNYGRGSWASSLRYHKGMYYVTTFDQTTNKTYVFRTKDIKKGNWQMNSFSPSYHDHSLVFGKDDTPYLIYGAGEIKMLELEKDLSGVKKGIKEKVIIQNATAPSGDNVGLPAEGSQVFEVNGYYYLFNISWPRGGMRTVIIHRAKDLNGPWEGKVAFQDQGIAQGGIIDTPDGKWYAFLFQDYGAVGRIPYMIPVTWEDNWPIIGNNGKLPGKSDLPETKSLIPGVIHSDNFSRKSKDADLPLVWQWNHNPMNEFWTVKARKGYLRLTTPHVVNGLMDAPNTLSQRMVGPKCSGEITLETDGMKEGDFAGFSAFQRDFGQVGISIEKGKKYLKMINGAQQKIEEVEKIPFEGNRIHFKIEADFTNRRDIATFYYSLDGKTWKSIGNELKMAYTLPHFMGYRLAIFNYATQESGGYVDIDEFRINQP